MGANGSAASGSTATEIGRRWKTVAVLPNGMKVIELKNPKSNHKAPEESQSPNSIYVMFNKDGNGIKSISKYDGDCKKVYEIHMCSRKKYVLFLSREVIYYLLSIRANCSFSISVS